jgi:acetylornithine/succinyldiaminopimelate/putrescine aminotransferase
VQYAELLAEHLPGHLNSVYFTSSGTEATEGAMKLAKRVTGRPQIISCINAYHGSSQGALSLAGREELKNSFRPLLPGTFQIRYNNFDDLKKINHSTAAVFAEPVQSEAGAITGQQEWFEALHNRCKEKGALLVLDEIQTGMGRTGTLWAFQSLGIEPDILLLGKAFGGGLPLGAFIASDTLMQQLTFDPVLGHITTFGGHPLSCTAGLTALRTLINSGLIAEVAEKEQHFREIFSRYPVYGKGLLLAVDLGSFDRVQTFIARAAAKGFITDWFLFNEHCIRISPPLIITHEEIESVRELAGIHI